MSLVDEAIELREKDGEKATKALTHARLKTSWATWWWFSISFHSLSFIFRHVFIIFHIFFIIFSMAIFRSHAVRPGSSSPSCAAAWALPTTTPAPWSRHHSF